MKPVYKIKPSGEKYAIFRPDGSKVNEAEFETITKAEKHLELLIALGYCRRER